MCGVAAHIIGHQGHVQAVLLALRRMTGAHSGEQIAEILIEVITEYGFTKNLGVYIGDNADSNDTAWKANLAVLYPDRDPKASRSRRLGHIINLAAKTFIFGKNVDADLSQRNVCGLEDTKYSNGDEFTMGDRNSNDVWMFFRPWAPVPVYHVIDSGGPQVLKVFRQIAEGIRHLHSKGIIHRDLKPDNIRLTSQCIWSTPVISDFGHATAESRNKDFMKGTISYLAPEIVALKQAEERSRERRKSTKTD